MTASALDIGQYILVQYTLNEKWVQNISNVEIMQETLFCGKKLIFEYLYVTGRQGYHYDRNKYFI